MNIIRLSTPRSLKRKTVGFFFPIVSSVGYWGKVLYVEGGSRAGRCPWCEKLGWSKLPGLWMHVYWRFGFQKVRYTGVGKKSLEGMLNIVTNLEKVLGLLHLRRSSTHWIPDSRHVLVCKCGVRSSKEEIGVRTSVLTLLYTELWINTLKATIDSWTVGGNVAKFRVYHKLAKRIALRSGLGIRWTLWPPKGYLEKDGTSVAVKGCIIITKKVQQSQLCQPFCV